VQYVSLGDLNAWMAKQKLSLSQEDLDNEIALEFTQAAHIKGRLSQAYDTSVWVDTDSTPALVRAIIAMRMAGWIWLRKNADVNRGSGDNSFGRMLLAESDRLLTDIEQGTISLDGETYNVDAALSETYDPVIDPAFTMGAVF
jgi:hypothetical protein